MLSTIREIGIFMIAAQAVIHFAPGKQYEKYIKSVSGVIILLLFLRPFLQLAGAQWKSPEAVLEKLEELTDMPDFPDEGENMKAGDAAVSRMETEVRALLNRELEGDEYCVKQVSIRLDRDSLQKEELRLSEIGSSWEKR